MTENSVRVPKYRREIVIPRKENGGVVLKHYLFTFDENNVLIENELISELFVTEKEWRYNDRFIFDQFYRKPRSFHYNYEDMPPENAEKKEDNFSIIAAFVIILLFSFGVFMLALFG